MAASPPRGLPPAQSPPSPPPLTAPRREEPAILNNVPKSPARDPRRSSRQNSIVPQPAPSAPSNASPKAPPSGPRSYGDKLVDKLTGISAEVSKSELLKVDQVKAKKKLDNLNHHHEKLKNLDQFPAAKDLVCQYRNTQKNEFEKLKKELIARKEGQKSLAKQAAGLLNDAEARGGEFPEEMLRTIDTETKSSKLLIENLKQEVLLLRKENTSRTKENLAFQNEIAAHEDELKFLRRNHRDDMSHLKKSQDRGIDQVSSDIRELRERIERQNSPRVPSIDSKQVEGLKSDISQLKGVLVENINEILAKRLSELEMSRQDAIEIDQNILETWTNRVNSIETRLSQHRSLNIDEEPLTNLSRQIANVSSRLTSLEMSQVPALPPQPPQPTPAPTDSSLHVKYEQLQKVMKEIIEVQAYKDDQQMKAIEDNHVKMGEQMQETAVQVRADVKSDFEKALEQIKDEFRLIQLEKMASLHESSEIHDSRLQTLETAIASLEGRYGNIHPDLIVDRTMPILQSLYPPPPVLHGVVQRLEGMQIHLSRIPDFSNLSMAIENHEKQLNSMHSQIAQASEDVSSRNIQAITEMRNHTQQLEQKIDDFKTNFPEMHELRDSFASFVHDNQQEIDTTKKNWQELNDARLRVTGEISTIQVLLNDLQSLSQDQKAAVDQLKEAQGQSPMLSVITEQLKDLQAQLMDLNIRIETDMGENKVQLRLQNLENTIKDLKTPLTPKQEGIGDKQKSWNDEVSRINQSFWAFREEMQQELQTLKEQLRKDSEAQNGQQNSPTEMRKMAREMHKMLKKIRELEQAKLSIKDHINERLQSHPNPESQVTVKFEPQSSQPDQPDARDLLGRIGIRKRKRPVSSANSSPRDSPASEGSQISKSTRQNKKSRTSMNVSSSVDVITIDD
ncbi:hypothetical protein BGW36DRAFT_431699 [Talaromyces proteolyticus]|uniref:Uncharacterized protein n=1 Tax=Talaromyces proteolyticus TaxID=1131652 RepID=A0AAD4KFH4_9EURO|nr:uncharacterized protein BGW36DRAFT_431699 [Talaromyces proteolyticus]KAH8691138.1 hypothetical protein BGW36DRAFT_431699 [Talaromyces proteolyticus]